MDGAEFFFEGVRRLDWGLGNPNKTAALIAEGMVAVWVLAYIRQRLFWLSAFLFTVLGCCLVLTFSRGGLAACCAGLTVLVAFAPRPWPRRKALAVLLAVTAIAVCAVRMDAHRRYAQGVLREDRSITNRMTLWKAAPAMMADAPKGWGAGNAGKAYMQWYQPLDRTERYRTLVNSHLTWLVEFGWLLRGFYLSGWLAVILLCGAGGATRWAAVPLGIWTAFGAASFFSSVAESPWLWGIPTAALLAVLVSRVRLRQWPLLRSWSGLIGLSVLLCVGLWTKGRFADSRVRGGRNSVVIGSGTPKAWLVAGEKDLGGESFAKTLRGYLVDRPSDFSIGVVRSLEYLPGKLSGVTVVMTGQPQGMTPERVRNITASASNVVLLAPAFYPQEFGFDTDTAQRTKIVFGEFSQSPYHLAWEETGRVRRVTGVGDYFPDWPNALFGLRIGD